MLLVLAVDGDVSRNLTPLELTREGLYINKKTPHFRRGYSHFRSIYQIRAFVPRGFNFNLELSCGSDCGLLAIYL